MATIRQHYNEDFTHKKTSSDSTPLPQKSKQSEKAEKIKILQTTTIDERTVFTIDSNIDKAYRFKTKIDFNSLKEFLLTHSNIIKSICFSKFNEKGTAVFLFILTQPKHLEIVMLDECKGLSIDALNQIDIWCRKLSRFIVKDNKVITDSFIEKITKLEELKILSLTNCPNLTTKSADSILKNCKNLDIIQVIDCIEISNNLSTSLPQIQKIAKKGYLAPIIIADDGSLFKINKLSWGETEST